MLQKKGGVLNFIILAHVSLKKIIYINFYCEGYENSKGLAIIQDFTAHWAIKNKQMVNVWTFDSVRMWDVLIYDSGIESNFQTIAICSCFIAQWAVKS